MAALRAAREVLAALADEESTADDREAAYVCLENELVRGSSPPGDSEEAAAVAAAAIKAIYLSVMCAPMERIALQEFQRAALLAAEITAEHTFAVCCQMCEPAGDDGSDVPLILLPSTRAAGSRSAVMLTKTEFTREDAVTAACEGAPHVPLWAAGFTEALEKVGMDPFAFMGLWGAHQPYLEHNAQPADRYLPLAMQLLDLIRNPDGQSEAIVCGAWMGLTVVGLNPRVAVPLGEAGFVELAMAALQKYSPLERIGRRQLTPTAIFSALGNLVSQMTLGGADVVPALLAAGAIDMAISCLTAYQVLGNAAEASVMSVWYGGLDFLDKLRLGSPEAAPIVEKLRSAGVDAFRFILDNPLAYLRVLGLETAPTAVRVAALVWGRDEDSGLEFTQEDIDQVVQLADLRSERMSGPSAIFFPLHEGFALSLKNLCVSDANKLLLLRADGMLRVVVDALLLDPDHPAQVAHPGFESAKVQVQRDIAEALHQLAVFPPGREALLADETCAEALQQVVERGWSKEAQEFAQSALVALRNTLGTSDLTKKAIEREKHVMLSCASRFAFAQMRRDARAIVAAATWHPHMLAGRVWLCRSMGCAGHD
jgi:hypothetical protein